MYKSKADMKQDKALMKGKSPAVKKAFMKIDKNGQAQNVYEGRYQKDKAIMKKIESKKGKK